MKSSLSFVFLFFALGATPGGAETLKDAFTRARANMESIKRADAQVTQTQELRVQARAAVLPTIAGVGSYTKIDPPSEAGRNPFLLTRQYVAAIRLSQPLLRGGLVSAYQLAQDNLLLARYQRDATEIALYQLVINAYYTLAVAQLDVKNVEELLRASRDRVREIRERTAIGRSRKGELVEAEAQLHIAESQHQQTLIGLDQAEKNFEFLTRTKPGPIAVESTVPDVAGPLEEYLRKVRTRPDVLASQQEATVAGRQIDIAKGGHFPQVDLTSNYYIDRTGILATSEWDVGVQVVVPLFQGGGVVSQVRAAAEGKRIAELRGAETLRTAERDVAVNYQNLLTIKEQLKFLRDALRKSEEVYRLNKRDYQFGLVTNLDVLQSLNLYIETKRSYDNLVSTGHLNYRNLEALTGVLP
jgi:outer membrane protein